MMRPRIRAGRAQARKSTYDAYMRSPAWFERRRAWAASERERSGRPPIVCVVCGGEWTLHDDLHHIDYSALQSERHEDLVPVHRSCHDLIHELLHGMRLLRRLPSRAANRHAIAAAAARTVR